MVKIYLTFYIIKMFDHRLHHILNNPRIFEKYVNHYFILFCITLGHNADDIAETVIMNGMYVVLVRV